MGTGADNLTWARTFVAAWIEGGVRHACVSPGSRSSPLTLAVAESNELTSSVHVDERSAGYFAVGYGRATGVPAVLVCTSGTAAANYLPAVVEADYGRVPMVVVTADRPPEARETGARQTIDQLELYGRFVRWFADLDVPSDDEGALRRIGEVGRKAATLAMGSPAGPVHLNVPFREPLLPDLGAWPGTSAASGPGALGSTRTAEPPRNADAAEPLESVAAALVQRRRGLVAVGQIDRAPFGLAGAIAELARTLGYPILAEPTSGLRFGPHDRSQVVSHHEALLRAGPWRDRCPAEAILHVGQDFVWRHVQEALAPDPHRVHVAIAADRAGARQHVDGTISLRGDPLSISRELTGMVRTRRGTTRDVDRDWTRRWHAADKTAARVLDELAMDSADARSSTGWVHRAVARLMPNESVIWLANSMAVRDADSFTGSGEFRQRYLSNWGAAGIDGTVSSALGAAYGTGRPTALVTGDLAFAHDLGGLSAARMIDLDVAIVVLNDGGGGIFEHLPVAGIAPDLFGTYFVTPSGLDVACACRAYSVPHAVVANESELESVVRSQGGVRVAEVAIDRAANTRWHRRYWAAVREAIQDGFGIES